MCSVFIIITQHQLESCTGISIQTGFGLICGNKLKVFKQTIYVRICVHIYNSLFTKNDCIIASLYRLRVKVAHVWFNLRCAVTLLLNNPFFISYDSMTSYNFSSMKSAEWHVNSRGTIGVVFVDELTGSVANQVSLNAITT